ncbi:MAG: RNA-directed DNA polymerase [Clostridiales bacterium]|nr:RNA-directed DNA polymerase [Clostridiales bacterium]
MDSDEIYACAGEIKAILDDVRPHYRKILIPKPNQEEMRTVFKVTSDLQLLQYFIKFRILDPLDRAYTSPYAFAYRRGYSARDNASQHSGRKYMLKLDIRHFFESTRAGQIYSMFRKYTPYNKTILGTLTRLVCFNGALCQGACTSPQIANLVLSDFDRTIGSYCKCIGVTYTRYCDDMTFSAYWPFNKVAVKDMVEDLLRPYHYKLNTAKTRFLGPGKRLEVTGAVINDRVHAKREYRHKLRQELYYACKYSVAEHLERTRPKWYHSPCTAEQVRHFIYSVQGRINYIRMLDPEDPFLEYAQDLFQVLHLSEVSAFSRNGHFRGSEPDEDLPDPLDIPDLFFTDLEEPPFDVMGDYFPGEEFFHPGDYPVPGPQDDPLFGSE